MQDRDGAARADRIDAHLRLFSRKIIKSRKTRNDAGTKLPTCRRKWIAGESLRDVELGSTRGRLRIWMRLILRMTQSAVQDRGVLRSAGDDEGFFGAAVGHPESTCAPRPRLGGMPAAGCRARSCRDCGGICQHKFSINYFR
jgi:hypothetical protein